MKLKPNWLIFVLLLSLCDSALANSPSIQLQYPELMVTPRASKRLQLEAKKEKEESGWKHPHSLMQVSGLVTLISGLYASSDTPDIDSNRFAGDPEGLKNKEDERDLAINLSLLVGAATIGTATYLGYKHRPYWEGYKSTYKLPTKSKRDDLTRERLAEEHIRKAKSLATRLKWVTAIGNALANISMMNALDNAEDSNTHSTLSGIAILTSFMPLFFNHPWEEVYEQHENYKKRIYGPVASPYLKENKVGQFEHGVQISMRF